MHLNHLYPVILYLVIDHASICICLNHHYYIILCVH